MGSSHMPSSALAATAATMQAIEINNFFIV